MGSNGLESKITFTESGDISPEKVHAWDGQPDDNAFVQRRFPTNLDIVYEMLDNTLS